MRLIKVILAISAIGLIIAGFRWDHKIIEEHKREATTLQTTLQSCKDRDIRATLSKREVIAFWIMNHSSRISDSTAQQIATEAFKYPHPILILSLIEAESEFTPTAVSKMGAVGLGQVIYNIHKKDLVTLGIHRKRDLFDIDKNMKATSFILQMMLKKDNGDIVKALHSYLGEKGGKYINRIFSNYVHLSLEIENAMPEV